VPREVQMKHRILFLIFMISSLISYSQTVEDYKSQRKAMGAEERFTFAEQQVQQSTKPEVINEAIQDLLKHSDTPNGYESALSTIRDNIHKLDSQNLPFIEARLAEAKFLARLGQRQEAETIFQNAIENEWKHALWRYSEHFIDLGELDQASILEYDRVVAKEKYEHYRDSQEDFFIFLTLLQMLKKASPEQNAVDAVSNQLDESTKFPFAKSIAHGLCLAVDERYHEAINVLKEVDTYLTDNRENKQFLSSFNEHQNIPLYLTWVILKERKQMEEADIWFNKFIERNDEDLHHVYKRSMRIVRDLSVRANRDLHKAKIITSQLLESPIIQDTSIKASFSSDEIAGIYDLHQQSLAWSGEYAESMVVAQDVVDKYYPDTLAGVNCAMNLAYYQACFEKQYNQGKNMITQIINESKFDEVKPWANLAMAKLLFQQQQNAQALPYVEQVLKLVTPNDQGSITRARKEALDLKKKLNLE